MTEGEQEALKTEVIPTTRFSNMEDGRDVSSSPVKTPSWYELTLLEIPRSMARRNRSSNQSPT